MPRKAGTPKTGGREKGVGDNTPRKHRRTGKPKTANLKPAWQPGQSGNPAGRPKGSRNHLSEMFLDEFCRLYEADGGKSLRWLQKNDPVAFVKAIIAVIPKKVDIEGDHAVYVISDGSLSVDDWQKKYARGGNLSRRAGADDSDGQPRRPWPALGAGAIRAEPLPAQAAPAAASTSGRQPSPGRGDPEPDHGQ